MTIPRPVDRALWVYGHFFLEPKPTEKRQFFASALPQRTAIRDGANRLAGGTTVIRCSVDSMSQKYADGRTRVVLAVRPEFTRHLPRLRIGQRFSVTLTTPVGDFEAGVRAWSSTSDRPYLCPDLFSKRMGYKETLAKVLEECHISAGSVVEVAVSGTTWKLC